MKLYVVQHGEARPEEEDPDRPLSVQGRMDILRLVPVLEIAEVSVPRMLHSGKTRARQTAELLEPMLAVGGVIEAAEGLSPKDSPEDFANTLDEAGGDLMIASHMPFVSRLVSFLVTGSPDRELLEFRPGSLAGLEQDEAGHWRIAAFVRPGFY